MDWQDKVTARAIEIAGDRAPEEGDFNTALVQLRQEVPAEELEFLQRDLAAVEAGTSSDPFWAFGDQMPTHTYCDGCGFCHEDCCCSQFVECPHCDEWVFGFYNCSECGYPL